MSGTAATGGSSISSPITSTPSARAVTTRWRIALDIAGLGRGQAEPPLAARELGDGAGEIVVREVRPQGVAEVELGVGKVPQKEIADALVASGTDEEVGLRHAVELQLRGEGRLVD